MEKSDRFVNSSFFDIGRPKKEKLYAVESVASWKDIKPAD
jgi:hypothetical protein